MSQMATTQGAVVTVKPQPNIYTVLLVVAIVALLIAMIVGLATLMSSPAEGAGYGLSFEQVITGKDTSTSAIVSGGASPSPSR